MCTSRSNSLQPDLQPCKTLSYMVSVTVAPVHLQPVLSDSYQSLATYWTGRLDTLTFSSVCSSLYVAPYSQLSRLQMQCIQRRKNMPDSSRGLTQTLFISSLSWPALAAVAISSRYQFAFMSFWPSPAEVYGGSPPALDRAIVGR